MDKEQYNEYMNDYMFNRYLEKIKEYIDMLGGKCVKCGENKNLEFDHIDPNTKSFNICVGWSRRKEVIVEELKKCQLLCKSCHVEKSIVESGKKIAKNTHGTISSYRYCKCDLCKMAKSVHNKRTKTYKPKQKKYGDEQIKNILELHDSGLSSYEIAKVITCVSRATIQRIIKKRK